MQDADSWCMCALQQAKPLLLADRLILIITRQNGKGVPSGKYVISALAAPSCQEHCTDNSMWLEWNIFCGLCCMLFSSRFIFVFMSWKPQWTLNHHPPTPPPAVAFGRSWEVGAQQAVSCGRCVGGSGALQVGLITSPDALLPHLLFSFLSNRHHFPPGQGAEYNKNK